MRAGRHEQRAVGSRLLVVSVAVDDISHMSRWTSWAEGSTPSRVCAVTSERLR